MVFLRIFADDMKKKDFLIYCIGVLILALLSVLSGCEFKNNYKKGCENVQVRQGRIAIIKQKSGHVREYVLEGDSGYFREALDCPKCAEEQRIKFVQDSVQRALKFKRIKEIEETDNEEGNARGTTETESHSVDSVHHTD